LPLIKSRIFCYQTHFFVRKLKKIHFTFSSDKSVCPLWICVIPLLFPSQRITKQFTDNKSCHTCSPRVHSYIPYSNQQTWGWDMSGLSKMIKFIQNKNCFLSCNAWLRCRLLLYQMSQRVWDHVARGIIEIWMLLLAAWSQTRWDNWYRYKKVIILIMYYMNGPLWIQNSWFTKYCTS